MKCFALRVCLICVLSSTAFATRSHAEIKYSEVPGDLTSEVIEMTVTSAAAPVPTFAHRFVPEDITLKSGNAAPYYYRVLLDLPRRMDEAREKYNKDEAFDRWCHTGGDSVPIGQLPIKDVRDAVEMTIGGWVWEQLVEATHRRECNFDLGLSEARGIDLIYISLEEFQRSREITRTLTLRTRLAVAEQRYDDAIASIRMNYGLAENFGSLPFIVSGLIGIAEASYSNGAALEMIAQPGSPNLYWAFTELPSPFVNMRSAARFELDFGPRLFPFIQNAATTDRSHDEWNRLLTQTYRDLIKSGSDLQFLGNEPLFGGGELMKSDIGPGLLATVSGLLGYSHAKSQLIAQGMDRERVEKMAVGQVMAIYTERNYQTFADEWESLWYMPFWETRRHESGMAERITAAKLTGDSKNREVIPLVSLLLPAMQAARNAQVRLEREIASLRVIEALRMYAADHNGKWPLALEDITQVPVPINPATGKEFVYHVDGTSAILELPASDGVHGANRRFEIQIVNK